VGRKLAITSKRDLKLFEVNPASGSWSRWMCRAVVAVEILILGMVLVGPCGLDQLRA
jgi:hypothetical protein